MDSNTKESTSFIVWIHRLFDFVIPISTLYLINLFYLLQWDDRYQALAIFGGLLLITFNQSSGVYSQWRGRRLFVGFKLVIKGWLITWLALLAFTFLFKDSANFSRVALASWFFITPIFLLLFRAIIRVILGYFRTKGWNSVRIAIVGAGNLGQRLEKTLINAKILGLIPVAFYDDKVELKNTSINGIPVKGSIDDLINQEHISELYDEIYITLPLRSEARIKQVLNRLADSTTTVKFIPDCFTFDLLHSRMTEIGGIPIIGVYDSPLNTLTNKFSKRSEDIILSSIILLMISPLLLLISLGILITSPGPVIFKQKRISWNGKAFNIYKFRSMPVNNNTQDQWGNAQEKTTTKFGQFIRRTSLDELPQFYNSLIGNMSIVGPRPEQDVFVEEFRKKIPRYMQKHMVKAGITGWAQINGWRGDTSLKKRIEYDLHYINNWSIWFDLKIILITFIKGFINKNAY